MEIRVKRGLKADLPILAVGEFGLCTDTIPNELYIGTDSGNFLVGSSADVIVTWADVAEKPLTFPPESHNHSGTYEPVITTKKTAFNVDFGTDVGTVCQGNDGRLSDTREPTAHTHDDRYFTEAETTAAISAAVNALVNGSPGALDTLNELATAMGDDPNFATTMTNLLSSKVDKVTGKQLSTEDFTTALLTKLNNINGTNTGDETASSIKSKLGITTLSGTNTGDQVIPTSLPASDVYPWAKENFKPNYTASEVGAAATIHTHVKANINDMPTKLSDFTNDIGAGGGVSALVIINQNRKNRMGGI